MLKIVMIMLCGIGTGYLLRNKKMSFIGCIITALIWVLLFLLGIEVGSNPRIISGLQTLGLEAIALTLGGCLGSALFAWALWKYVTAKQAKSSAHAETRKRRQGMKGSLIIVSFFVLGIIVGLCDVIPAGLLDSDVSYYALCCLMFCVGISIGCDTSVLKSFKKVNPRLMMLPVMTILGTLAGCAAVSLILSHRQLTDCLAIGSGFGYYSLSSIFITEYRGTELGTIALLANICREILTLLCAPLLAKYFGKLAPISVGGATTMDTTLPIITRYSGESFIIVSIFHGFCVDFSVPFLVTFFCSL